MTKKVVQPDTGRHQEEKKESAGKELKEDCGKKEETGEFNHCHIKQCKAMLSEEQNIWK
jgi:hypothetical protein